jgi:hypothetical protein
MRSQQRGSPLPCQFDTKQPSFFKPERIQIHPVKPTSLSASASSLLLLLPLLSPSRGTEEVKEESDEKKTRVSSKGARSHGVGFKGDGGGVPHGEGRREGERG